MMLWNDGTPMPCYCPDDCSCQYVARMLGRVNVCGCEQHAPDGSRIQHAQVTR